MSLYEIGAAVKNRKSYVAVSKPKIRRGSKIVSCCMREGLSLKSCRKVLQCAGYDESEIKAVYYDMKKRNA